MTVAAPIRLPRAMNARTFALSAFVFVLALLATAPAALIPALARFEQAGVKYRKATGTIWRGAFHDLEIEGAAIERLEFSFLPIELFFGRIAGDVRAHGALVRGGGRVAVGLGHVLVRNVDLDVDLAAYRRFGVLGAPLEGRAILRDASVEWRGDQCRSATGAASTDMLRAVAARFRRDGFEISGPIRCNGPDLHVDLVGDGPDGALELTIRLEQGLAFTLDARVKTPDQEISTALRALGFRADNGALRLGHAGSIRRTRT